jgi:alanyl-tRNA synthetase
VVFKLYDTYGLAVDLVEDVARDENLVVDLAGYKAAMGRQRSLSQESWKGSGEAAVPETFRRTSGPWRNQPNFRATIPSKPNQKSFPWS